MTIFTGMSDIILWFILFILIYCMNDSLISQVILFTFTSYAADIYVRLVMVGTNPDDVKFALFFAGLVAFTLGNIYIWINDWSNARKNKSESL